MMSNDKINAVLSDYAKAVNEIINSNTPQGYNCTFDQKIVSSKRQCVWQIIIGKIFYLSFYFLLKVEITIGVLTTQLTTVTTITGPNNTESSNTTEATLHYTSISINVTNVTLSNLAVLKDSNSSTIGRLNIPAFSNLTNKVIL